MQSGTKPAEQELPPCRNCSRPPHWPLSHWCPPAATTAPGWGTGTDNSFKLTGGTIPNAIKQGDTESVKVTLDRGKNFHQTVKLEAKGPDKVHATLDRTTVKDGESPDVNVKIHPADDAPAGDYKVTVTGTPDTGTRPPRTDGEGRPRSNPRAGAPGCQPDHQLEETAMLRLALVFLIVALVSAMFGFGLIADFTFDAAKILFFVFLMLAVVSFIADAFRGRTVDPV